MHAKNILHLGVKELWSLAHDPILLLLIAYVFTVDIYSVATGAADTLHKTPLAIVDEDQSPLSLRIVRGFQMPWFLPPKLVTGANMDARMDAGLDTFALDIPPRFQEDVLAGRARLPSSSTPTRPASGRRSPAVPTRRRSSPTSCRHGSSATAPTGDRQWISKSACVTTPI